MKDKLNFLQTVEIFKTLNFDELTLITKHIKEKKYYKNDKLFSQGEQGKEFFIVVDGLVSISIELPDGGMKKLAEFDAGNFFGELILFDDAPRSATCISESESILLVFPESSFIKLVSEEPILATKIMTEMATITSKRLEHTSEFLQEMVYWGESARKRAITDEFTGAYNRRYLEEQFDSFADDALENNQELSMVMVDLDYFRQINEQFSTEIGDEAILAVVGVFNKLLREQDMLVRYGGDEFSVIMPDTKPEEAKAIIETIRRGVETLEVLPPSDGPLKNVTLSLGIASLPRHTKKAEELQGLADEALYQAKESGRNRVLILHELDV